MLPNPTMATFTVSLGARPPRPSTRLGTINGAAPAAMVPRAVKPASATNSRRVRSLVFDISPLLPRRFPLAPGHRGNEFIQAARRERERLALFGALIGRHQEFHDLQAVIEGQQRLFLAEKRAHEMTIFVLIAVCRASFAMTGISPISAFCFSTRSSPCWPRTAREKKSFKPLSSVFHDIEYSGPRSSADKRSPGPTKLHDVDASPITI